MKMVWLVVERVEYEGETVVELYDNETAANKCRDYLESQRPNYLRDVFYEVRERSVRRYFIQRRAS